MGALRKYLKLGLLIACGWTLFALFFAGQALVYAAYFNRPVNAKQTLLIWFTCAYIWAVMTPPVLWLTRFWPLRRADMWRGLTFHFAVVLGMSFLQLAVYTVAYHIIVEPLTLPFWPSYQNFLVTGFHENLLIYTALVGISHAVDYYRRFRERERHAAQLEVEAAQLETQLTRAQLNSLKMQLHPHFLFNTLNTISVLMKRDVAAADDTLARLGDLLRRTIRNTDRHEVALAEELDFLRSYLKIEETRFNDRLEVTIDADDNVLNARVPNLILQPLVENCIRHAVAPRVEATDILISASRDNGRLILTVVDNGPGLSEEGEPGGIGLSNTRSRLEKLYGPDHRFELSPAEDGGLKVTVSFPYRVNDES